MFRSQWNSYKNNSRKFDRGEDFMQRHLYQHFQLPGHTGFLQDTYVTLIDKTNPRAPTKHEDYWIHTLIRQKCLWDLMLKVDTKLLSCIVIV